MTRFEIEFERAQAAYIDRARGLTSFEDYVRDAAMFGAWQTLTDGMSVEERREAVKDFPGMARDD